MVNKLTNNFLDKMEVFHKSEEFLLYKTLRQLRLALTVHRFNYRILRKSILNAHERAKNPEFWRPPDELWRLQNKITTELLNYLGSKETIKNITDNRFIKEHFDEQWMSRYSKYKSSTFGTNAEFKTINRLRTFLVHYSIPNIGISLGINEARGKYTKIYLHKNELLKWKSWNADERAYLEALPDDFDIRDPIERFHIIFMDTQNRIFLEAVSKYSRVLEKLPQKMKQLFEEGETVRYSESLHFRPSWIKYIEYILAKSKQKGLDFSA